MTDHTKAGGMEKRKLAKRTNKFTMHPISEQEYLETIQAMGWTEEMLEEAIRRRKHKKQKIQQAEAIERERRTAK